MLSSIFDLLSPIKAAWWQLFGAPTLFALAHLSSFFNSYDWARAIGPLGLAIIALTIGIKTVLFPLVHAQLTISRKSQAEQRKIAPDLAALRQRFSRDPRRLRSEMLKLYQKHRINPLAGVASIIPVLLQSPMLYALYFVIADFQAPVPHHFLWVHDLARANDLLLAALAASVTYLQTIMLSLSSTLGPAPEHAPQVGQGVTLIGPLLVGVLAWNFAAGIALYWVISGAYQIGQQSVVVGWGSVFPALGRRVSAVAPGPPRGWVATACRALRRSGNGRRRRS